MLAVPFFEKQLYELSDDQVTPEIIQKLADDVEIAIQGLMWFLLVVYTFYLLI